MGTVAAACAPAAPQIVEVEKPVVVKEEVIKEVPVEKIVEKEKIVEVEKEKIVERVITPTARPREGAVIKWLMRHQPGENDWQMNWTVPHFEEKYTGATVNLILSPGGQLAAKTMAMYAAGDPPDVQFGWGGMFFKLYAQEQVLELGPYIDADGFDLTPFGPTANDPDMCRSGKQYGIPFLSCYGEPIFYNVDMFEDAGIERPPTDWKDESWNWDRIIEIGTKLTKNYGQPDAVYGLDAMKQFHNWAYSFGGDSWTAEWYQHGIAEDAFLLSKENYQGAQLVVDLIHKYKIMPTPADTSALNQLGNPFKTSRLGMNWTGGWGYWTFNDITAFRWAAAPCPWGVDNKTAEWCDCIIGSGLSNYPELAWGLISTATSREGQMELARINNTPPPREDAFDAWLDAAGSRMDLSREQVREVALGYRDNYMDNWAHYVINAREYQIIQNQEGEIMWSGDATVEEHMPIVKEKMDAAAKKAFDEYKDTRIMTDEWCRPLYYD